MNQVDYNKWYYKIIYFFIVNQVIIKRGLIIFLIVVSAALWTFGIVKWTDYILTTAEHNNSLSSVAPLNYTQLKQCQNITLADFDIKPTAINENINEDDTKQWDFLAKVKNPNTNCYAAKIKYYFTYDGHQEENRVYHEEVLMPGAEKYLFSFGETIDMPVLNNVSLVIAEQSLLAVGKGAAKNYAEIFNQLGASDVDFVDSTATFTAFNNSDKDLWQVGYQVVIFSDAGETEPVAAAYVTVNKLLANSKQQAQANWFKDLAVFFPTVDVVVDANTFDSNVYMQRDFGPGVPQGVETK